MELKRLLLRQKPIDSMEMDFCANMYNEAALIAQENYPESRQDLFMEQGEQNTGTEFRDSNALIINWMNNWNWVHMPASILLYK